MKACHVYKKDVEEEEKEEEKGKEKEEEKEEKEEEEEEEEKGDEDVSMLFYKGFVFSGTRQFGLPDGGLMMCC